VDLGKEFRFKLIAISELGEIDYPIVRITYSLAPKKIVNFFIYKISVEEKSIILQWNYNNNLASNNGSPIESFELIGSLSANAPIENHKQIYSGFQNYFIVNRIGLNTIEIGYDYYFKIRSKNSVGFSDWSETLKVSFTFKPSKPVKPWLASVTSTQITLKFSASNINAFGSPVINYKLYYALNDVTNLNAVGSYNGVDLEHTLNKDIDSLILGKVYKFCLTVLNNIGESECSEFLFVGFTSMPSKINLVEKVNEYSNNNSLTIKWNLLENTNSPAGNIIGYGIYLSDVESSDLTSNNLFFFDTSQVKNFITNSNFFTFNNLVPNTKYFMQIRGKNMNEFGINSDIYSFYTCMKPDRVRNLRVLQIISDSITIAWDLPANIGGCPLKGIKILRDDGNNGVIDIEANIVDEPLLANNPFIGSFKITNLPVGSLGRSIRFVVIISNTSESAMSEEFAILHVVPIA